MKKAEAIKQWEVGSFLIPVEFRKSIAEVIAWRDKATGKAMTAPVVRHTVETATATLTVNERVPDDFNVGNFKQPFEKGKRVLLSVTELHQERGNFTARGVLLPLED